ncbi:ATP-binding protein [Candidatus Poribacteria bacterium]|nr:ATP-binding protein [Candidatus Poribacteria bacterium]
MANIVVASPSKMFFVEMLTRDIDLKDAILDLLDNCVDGILRQLNDQRREEVLKSEKPYDSYWAKITANPEKFSIEDNCGGISRKIAINSAFRLGRSLEDLQRDKDIATVGVHGIGMKRALFKMGRHSKVISQHKRKAYCVEIPPEWLDDDKNWNLELNDTDMGWESDGTSITVTNLHQRIAYQFDADSNPFLKDLQKEIANLFAVSIKKGFRVSLNGKEIEPVRLEILFPKDLTQESAIQPYAYKGTVDYVDIELAIGFYRELASESELEDEQKIPRKTDNAGWTVICNDRVVLHHDKMPMTGWGVRNVPKYHTQFIAIAGVVQFSSNDSLKLPINTTKRGLDTSSAIYWHTLNYMMEGLKKFTDFTNHWKGRESETASYFSDMSPKDATEVPEAIPQNMWKEVRGSGADNERRFTPNLPRPPKDKLKHRISFLRLKEEIEIVGEDLFGNPEAPPAEIGNRCFEDALKKAKGKA